MDGGESETAATPHFSSGSQASLVQVSLKVLSFHSDPEGKKREGAVKEARERKEGAMSIGVPIKVLHEAEGHMVTLETTTGEVFRGKLLEAEDNMNCQMANVNVTYRDGRNSNLELVFIRGSKIRFLILPDMLKNAPMFKRVGAKGSGGGPGVSSTSLRGKVPMMRGAGGRGGRGGGGRGGPGGGPGGAPRGRGQWGPGGGRGK